LETLLSLAQQFHAPGTIQDVREYGNGNINDTFLAIPPPESGKPFILQRINPRVFRRPELVMQNIRTVTEHVSRRFAKTPPGEGDRFELPRILPSVNGTDWLLDREGSFWRAMTFIDGATSFDTVRDTGHAEEVGRALGLFHWLISDLSPRRLSDTLEGFHVTPGYLLHYDAVLAAGPGVKSARGELDFCLRFVRERRAFAHVLEHARKRGYLYLRPTHGDPKVNNVLVDNLTQRAVSIVDLDTVKPGLVHCDIGDCLRSCCNPLGEAIEQWEEVRFELDICRAALKGYLSLAGGFLTEKDRHYLFDSIRLIPFELGLRFLTDHLEGDVYFKVRHRGHNLMRALVQFKLTESIERQESFIRAIIGDKR
jgi:hypothetical protein